jgi:hypothetical protein
MAVDSWVWNPVVPTVSAISPSTGPITGGTSVTITGTGFVTGTTVSFIEESNGTPVSDNVVLPATSVTVNGPTSLTVAAPAATEGTTYFVTATTATGISAYSTSANDVFTYSPVAPTITAVSPASGGIAGGNSVTISGTGFYNGATVDFVQESGGSPVVGGVTAGATYVSVTGSTTITAVSPAVTSPGTYFVTVATPAGTTPTGANDRGRYGGDDQRDRVRERRHRQLHPGIQLQPCRQRDRGDRGDGGRVLHDYGHFAGRGLDGNVLRHRHHSRHGYE